ncbi:MAG: signal peptide peptidase SppA [Candidatus Altiarchaeota archaeon]|nr:signal peptide peptidase SppA [Candidatus Altiarchaeota archaeon]
MKARWKVLLTFIGVFIVVSAIFLTILLIYGFQLNELPVIGQRVSVIPIRGTLTMEGCGGSIFGTPQCVNVGAVKEELRFADNDPTIKAIVLDINSGGGSVVPSKELARAVRNTRKPVVACIREVGASGAYYVASAADHIVADSDSITGSIGVIMTVQHTYGLYEKLGINVTVIKSGEVKDIGSPYREMTDEEKQEFKDMVDTIYDGFVGDVAINRNLSRDYVESISDGSIYLGSEALELDLVDSLGDIDDAIGIASGLGRISGAPSVKESKPKGGSIWDYL